MPLLVQHPEASCDKQTLEKHQNLGNFLSRLPFFFGLYCFGLVASVFYTYIFFVICFLIVA